jgi:hypothetical protein
VHPAGGKLDHEQHVQTLEQSRVEVEAVDRQDAFGLCGQELSPRQSRAVRRRPLDSPAAATPATIPAWARRDTFRCVALTFWRPLMRAATASTRHVEQADHGAFGLVPDRNHFGRRQQLNLALVALEVGGRLLRQHHRVVLARAEEEPRRALLVDVLGLGQRDGVRGAIQGLGQLLLAFL